jgi:hypothetical protein
MFRNREDAGRQLAMRLKRREFRDPLVLAIPRGGVVTEEPPGGHCRRAGAPPEKLDILRSWVRRVSSSNGLQSAGPEVNLVRFFAVGRSPRR